MGQAQTTEQKVNTAKSTIENLHIEVQKLEQVINQEVNRLEKDIANANYTDLNKLCDQIGYQYVDRLSAHFPVSTLEGYGRIKLGLEPQPVTESMEKYKQSVCKNIVAFYQKKLFLLEQIRKETPKCQVQEASVYNNLSEKLRSEGIDTEQWLDVYKKMQKFNKDIKYQYSVIANSVQKIRDAQTWAQLNTASKDTIELLNNTNSICTRYQADLNRFSQSVPVLAPEPSPPRKPLPTPPIESSSVPASVSVPLPTPVSGSLAADIPPLVRGEAVPEKPVEVKKEPIDIPVNSQAVLTQDFSYKGQLVATKDTEVKVLAYDNKGWAKVETSDGKVKYVARNILRPIVKQSTENVDELFKQAIISGKISTVNELLYKGANIHKNNEEALYLAGKSGNEVMVKFLLKNGADTDNLGKEGRNKKVLEFIYKIDQEEYIKELKSKGILK